MLIASYYIPDGNFRVNVLQSIATDYEHVLDKLKYNQLRKVKERQIINLSV